ncbi:MAG TPA: T9SS type A sorting domain-containing protein [Candidatus Cloacimonadota bacterium]|nr:T9SS type A sorting domain-containing protein [Candidatus Cloacimonadota bacterium]
MKNSHLLFLLLLLFSNILWGYQWNAYGPDNVPISKADWHIPAVLVNGDIYLQENGNWGPYSYMNLDVIDFVSYNADKLMVILGTGSNSDGVYFFNLQNHTFQLLRWTMNPIFVKYCSADSKYYVGGLEGLYKTTDGTDWTEVSIPGTGSVTDFANYGSQFIVAKNNQVWHSPDGGFAWIQSPYGSLIHNFRFDDEGVAFGIINAGTYSDGIWHSFDYGANWTVIEWTLHVSCIGPKFNNNVVLGWYNGEGSQTGVGMTVPGGDFVTLNTGLPNLNIKCMDDFDLINTPSFWVGTDNGAYYCTGFLTDNEDQVQYPEVHSTLTNYPNPFNNSTTITYKASHVLPELKISIFNIKGELVFQKELKGSTNVQWNGENEDGEQVSSGLYLSRISSGNHVLAIRRMVKVK